MLKLTLVLSSGYSGRTSRTCLNLPYWEAPQRAICAMKPAKLIPLAAFIFLVSCAPKTGERIRESTDQSEKGAYELLRPGLPMNTVREAWGSPDKVEENCYRDECLIVWIYKGSTKVRYLFFENGILVSWQ